MTATIDYKFQANFVEGQIETLTNLYPDLITSGLISLKESMGRIKSIDDPTTALQDHFNAISCLSNKEINILKTLPGEPFTMCECLLKLLIASGASFKVTG